MSYVVCCTGCMGTGMGTGTVTGASMVKNISMSMSMDMGMDTMDMGMDIIMISYKQSHSYPLSKVDTEAQIKAKKVESRR